MKLVHFLTSDEVISRALELVASPLPHEWATCEYDLGPYCLRCALAHATTELARDLRFDAGDDALEWAVLQIRIVGDTGLRLDQAAAEEILRGALARVMEDQR